MTAPRPRPIALDAALDRLGPPPLPMVAAKIVPTVDANARRFIARSPLLFVATSDGAGHLDCSPRGDHPGFVAVLDDRLLAIPERRGNRLAQSLRNLAEHPGIGLAFAIPGRSEVLRVNGTGYLSDEPDLLDRLAAGGSPALLATVVDVEEVYIHCGRALLRARAWDPDQHHLGDDVPSLGRFLSDAVAAAGRGDVPVPTVAEVDEDTRLTYQQLY